VLYVPAESVYAVFDVKHHVRRPAIEDAAEKAESVRRLKRTSVPVRFVAGTYKPKEPFEIVAGILALESWWADGMGEALKKVLGECTQAGFLNLGCSMRDGSFEARPTNRGVEVTVSTRETALIFFFLRLLDRLQKVGTVPAMDLMKYGARLERGEEVGDREFLTDCSVESTAYRPRSFLARSRYCLGGVGKAALSLPMALATRSSHRGCSRRRISPAKLAP